jgi:hypothetical protein
MRIAATNKRRKWSARDTARLQERVVNAIFASLIADGHVDPEGKSDKELYEELARYASILVSQPYIPEIRDHRSTILSRARALAKERESEIAVMLYATWFEHWINGLMSNRGRHVPLSDKESTRCLYQVGLEAKYLCFPSMFHLPAITRKHINAIIEIAGARNEFVHYKFKAFDIDKPSPIRLRCEAAIKSAERTIRYLKEYERIHIFKKAKTRVKGLIREGSRN